MAEGQVGEKVTDDGMGKSAIAEHASLPQAQGLEPGETNASGHVQELKRHFSLLSLVGMALTVGNVWPAIGGSIVVALSNGGPPGVIYEFIVVSIFYWFVAASIAELASAIPSSAGVYQWATITGGPRWGRVIGFFAGYWNWLAWVFGLASFTMILATTMVQMWALKHVDFVPLPWHVFVTYILVTLTGCATVCAFNKAMPMLNRVGLFFILAGFLITIVIVTAMPGKGGRPEHASSETVWKTWTAEGFGYPNGFVFVAGMLNGAYAVGTPDVTSHLAEEIPRAERNVPIAIAFQMGIGFATGLVYLIAIMYAINDFDSLYTAQYPIAEIYRQATGSVAGSIGLLFLVLICIYISVIGLHLTCGRTLWALARDGATPFPRALGRVSPRLGMPLNATLVTTALLIVLGAIYVGNTTAFNAFVGSYIQMSTSSYLAAILPNLLSGRRNIRKWGPFRMTGVIGFAVNGIACVFMIVWFIIYCFPFTSTPTAQSMNYASLLWEKARHRPGYARVPSVSVVDELFFEDGGVLGDSRRAAKWHPNPNDGLGIAVPGSTGRSESVVTPPLRKPVTSGNVTDSPEAATPGSAKPHMSPPSTGGFLGSTRFDSNFGDVRTSYNSYAGNKHQAHHSQASLNSFKQPSVYAHSEAGLLSVRTKYDDFAPDQHCRSAIAFKRGRLTWLSATIMILSIYSTIMSAIFLIVALRGPRYGRTIRTNGALTISGATVLTTFFAKTIELSFITVIVALLGQALARRAHDKAARGITLAEISMRSWILQPGTLITHWESVRYAGITLLGVISLLAAVMAMLYVTAANALVQPQLKFNEWQPTVMQGLVKSSFANPKYIASDCKYPIPADVDPSDGSTTCLQLEHSAMAFHNYYGYLNTWHDVAYSGNGSADLASRPKGYALLHDNTTIIAPWIEQEFANNMTALYKEHNIIVLNVSMAMPHVGVISAAIDSINGIMQPEDLDGLGIYRIKASLPSPVVHVLCATLTEEQLLPLTLSAWENATSPDSLMPSGFNASDPYLGGTKLDAIFGWGEAYGEFKWPPVFPKLPIGYNTIINETTGIPYGRDAVYLVGNSTAIMRATGEIAYPLCQVRVSQTPICYTTYNASSSGASMEAICGTNDPLQYNHSLGNATSGNFSLNKDWPNIASMWIKSISLDGGLVDANGSNSRLLNQLVTLDSKLNLALPSISEALAVMAGYTLLQSTKDTPFVEFWNYSALSIEPGQYQYFNASIQAQQYQSGGNVPYQRAFVVILFAVFILNLCALVYFLTHRDWYTDLSEPSNLFGILINSPPSRELAEACGGGPTGEQFRSSWKLQDDGGHLYMESMDPNQAAESPSMRRRRKLSEGFEMMASPIRKATESVSERMGR
ncbi:hypothetical protein B0A48_05988 [Cryoendolithus antarcticus]|uniref:Uncharacterized protein n=1 Tax=Cryoendolithus antarcticus TaxID=1507870 RepID=A0A1V8TCI6_9PEZI|nr:hypothetical protein B0A48_05988 [Cryoendolithus antarcticus]